MKSENKNRKIKFRWKDSTGQWIHGTLLVLLNHPVIFVPKVLEETGDILKETLGQFTGVKDKNGEEIYEGDVVFDGEFTGLVWCFRDSACYTVVYGGTSKNLEDDHPDHLEIIGNVFDNPEYKKRFGRVFEDES